MSRRVYVVKNNVVQADHGPASEGEGEAAGNRAGAPAAAGGAGLTDLLGTGPLFEVARRGYDRPAVDSYVETVEADLAEARQQLRSLMVRYRACSTALVAARRPPVRPAVPVPGSGAMALLAPPRTPADDGDGDGDGALPSAAVEAAEEADRIRAEARTEAAARLANVAVLREAATAARDEARRDRDQARRDRETATDELGRAREEAARLLQEAADERRRRDTEAAEARARAAEAAADRLVLMESRARAARESATQEAAAQLAALEDEIADLRSQRDEAHACLRRLTGQIEQALQSLTAVLPDDASGLEEARALGDPRMMAAGVLEAGREPVAG
jgi:colicin import membrane protein